MGRVVMFPGQGAQSPGMGRPWASHPAWSVVKEAEEILGEHLESLLVGDEELTRTADAQMAMLLMGLVVHRALADEEADDPPVAMAGHSLGQITALIAAGILDRADGFRLARARADATQRAVDATPSTMVALLGADRDQAAEACAAAPNHVWPANYNAPGQIVLGGTPEGVDAAAARASELGVRRVRRLEVNGAFHTPLMATAAEELGGLVAEITFRAGAVPVVANDSAALVTDANEWPWRLLDHLIRPVRWDESVAALVELGGKHFVEAGADTLCALVRRADRSLDVRSVLAPSDLAVGAQA
ncbi:MAG TPA: ACP S-malonyltransferase [Acidimicrobiales bacterium]